MFAILLTVLPCVLAQTPTVPQIPAFLPTIDSVPAAQALPLDGTWLINSIRKKVRIEGGRAYVIDPWVHLFVLKVEAGMVVIKNIAPTAAGRYSGDDLPLLGTWSATVQTDRSLSVAVAGVAGPVSYTMTPVQLDNPGWYAQEMAAAGLTPPPAAVQPGAGTYQPSPPPGTATPGMPIAPPGYTLVPQAPSAPPPGYQYVPQTPPPPGYRLVPDAPAVPPGYQLVPQTEAPVAPPAYQVSPQPAPVAPVVPDSNR